MEDEKEKEWPAVNKWPKDKGPSLWRSDVTVYCGTKDDHKKELKSLIERFFSGQEILVDFEYSGAGTYRFQAWMNRPEGLPLVSLKWSGL